ncbi:MAG TPA: RDD family protein, partial [Longimicrobiaceae bacterium]|nr:RDD family protein [Longimicrobiaceae bacterium]
GAAAPGGNDVTVCGVDGLRTAAAVLAFRRASDPARARSLADAVVRAGRGSGIADADIREMMNGIAADAPDRPWLRAAVDSAFARAAAPAAPDTARALTTGDSLALLRTENQRLSARNAKLQADVRGLEESSNKPDLVSFLESFVKEEFGLGIGWVGLYFVATVALFRGRTPGKRLLGIRIIRLNGKPIGWWAAFERFGGYAAGLATGLLGFFQIFWDQNRQAIHDRIAETVVIDERVSR